MRPVNTVVMNKKTGDLYLITNQLNLYEILAFVVLQDQWGFRLDWHSEDFVRLGEL
jgi:hypothetical protein